MTAHCTLELDPGALVRHIERPGVWRLLGLAGGQARIEPWDDLAGGSLHASEAYVITARMAMLVPLRSGGPAAECAA